MPFDRPTPRPFTHAAVRTYAPGSPGVYGISNAREWIYIGECDNIQSALLAHLQDTQALLMRRFPTGFVFEMCEGANRVARQDRLIREYEPMFNRRGRG